MAGARPAQPLGQDISDRDLQSTPPAGGSLSVAKSRPGFGPTGPVLVTPDEWADPGDITLDCLLNGDVVQSATAKEMIFSIPELIGYTSSRVPLFPGDLIFTGTPSGVGRARTPPRLLVSGDELITRSDRIGRCGTSSSPPPRRDLALRSRTVAVD